MATNKLIGDRISEEEFLNAYNNHLPNKWIKFAFRYFSQSTEQKDKWISKTVQGILIALFVLGFLGTILEFSRKFMLATLIPFAVILIGVVVLMLGGAIMNNLRIRKICKELRITKKEYELLAAFYLP